MHETKQLKVQGLRYGRSLQAALRIAIMLSVEHPSVQGPLKHSFERLNAILKTVGQLTIGFVDRQVLINRVLTLDDSLARLENDFLKRDIGAVTFDAGLTLARYKQAISLFATSPSVIAQEGGVRAFLERTPIEGVRILPAARNQRRNADGDTLLDSDSESYLLSRNLESGTHDVMDSVDMLLESAALDKTTQAELKSTLVVEEVPQRTKTPESSVAVNDHLCASHTSGRGFFDIVENAVERSLVDANGLPEKSYVALARLLRDTNLASVLSRFPQARQQELGALPPQELAAELFEDTAVRWARKRFEASSSDQFLVEEEVVQVLARTVRATQMADRLAQKLLKFVEEHTLPRHVYERIQDELRWTSRTTTQKQAELLRVKRFDALRFRRLMEHIKDLIKEGNVHHAAEIALHYLQFLDLPAGEISSEELARLPELIRAMPLGRERFAPLAINRLGETLLQPDVPQFLHYQVASALAVLAQSIAVYEDFDDLLLIGSFLERASERNPEAHVRCCTKGLATLLPAGATERVIELYLLRREEVDWARTVTTLLRWSALDGIEQTFHRLEIESNAKNRLALMRLIPRLGTGAIDVARQRLSDERWYVVRNATLLLHELRDPELLQHLAPLLSHSDERVQQTVISILIKQRMDGRARAFAEALTQLHPNIADQVLDELLFLKDPETLPALQRFVLNSQGRIELAKKAVRTIDAICDDRAVQSLGTILVDEALDSSVRQVALMLLRSRTSYSSDQSECKVLDVSEKLLAPRRSDRVHIPMQLEVSGTDPSGCSFREKGTAEIVNRCGGTIVLSRPLDVGQHIRIRREGGREVGFRVVGQLGTGPAGFLYGVALLDPEPEFWGILFPSPDPESIAKLLLQCERCATRHIVEVDEIELEVFNASDNLSRHCVTCAGVTRWTQALIEAPRNRIHRLEDTAAARSAAAADATAAAPVAALVPKSPGAERRQRARLKLKMSACIPPPDGIGNDDIVRVLDVSKSGLRVQSHKRYIGGQWIQIAVPFTPGTANIFTQARVVWRSPSGDNWIQYGIKYVKSVK